MKKVDKKQRPRSLPTVSAVCRILRVDRKEKAKKISRRRRPCGLPALFLGRLLGHTGRFEREGEEVEKAKTEASHLPSHHTSFLVLREAVKKKRKSDQRQESEATESQCGEGKKKIRAGTKEDIIL